MSAADYGGLQLADRRARLELGLWSAVVALAVLDAATTVVALSLGLPEAGPLIRLSLGLLGPLSLAPVKVIYLAGAFVLWREIEPPGRLWALAVATLLLGAVVVNNLAWIVLAGGP